MKETKMFKSLMKALLALTLTWSAAQAMDGTLAPMGVAPFPIENNNVTLIDEQIVFEGVPTEDGLISVWKAHCTFHFKNETAVPQKVTMGVPFERNFEFDLENYSDATEEEIKALPQANAAHLLPTIPSFKAKVRGADVKLKEIRFDHKETKFHNAWVWEVTFAPGETVEVINSFEHGSDSAEGLWGVGYGLMTGKSWKGGKIGRLQLEVRPNVEFIKGDLREELVGHPKGARVVTDGKFRKAVWDLKDFVPDADSDLYFGFYLLKDWLSWQLERELGVIPLSAVGEKSCEQLRILRNSVYAWYGYPFKSADLKAYFSKKSWYTEDPKFDIKKLSPMAQRYISEFTKELLEDEKANGCRK